MLFADFFAKEGNKNSLYGKLYEWDAFNAQRDSIWHTFSRFDLPDDPTNAGVDLTEHKLFGGTVEYQMKSNISGIPEIKPTTSHSVTVITPAENMEGVERQGYRVDAFMDRESVADRRREMEERIDAGDVTPEYEFGDIVGTVGKSALFATAIGIGVEALCSYRDYKNGKIDGNAYVKGILMAGGDKGISAGATAGVMIPVNAGLTGLGLSGAPLTVPIAFVLHHTIAAPVSAAFGRGEYKAVLQDARLYSDSSEMILDFGRLAQESSERFVEFLRHGQSADIVFSKRRDEFEEGIAALEKMMGGKIL